MSSPLDVLPQAERRLLRPGPAPPGSAAMKAVLTDQRFSDPDWIFERKLDGIRCIAVRDRGQLRLLSRNDLSLNQRYPELVEALQAQGYDRFAIDGEVVAFSGSQTSFALLAQRGQRHVEVFFYIFDVLWLDGQDVRFLPLRSRKRLLRMSVEFGHGLRLTAHRNEQGEAMFADACHSGWEGLIAKRATSTYSSQRSRDWLKFKCEHGQELVIAGYTAPRGSREHFGALLLGYYQDGALRYAGKVGTGFDQAMLEELGDRMRALEQTSSSFADAASIRERDVTWVRPELVAQVGFTEWTRHGRLRHPRFLGPRDDKPAREVVREAP